MNCPVDGETYSSPARRRYRHLFRYSADRINLCRLHFTALFLKTPEGGLEVRRDEATAGDLGAFVESQVVERHGDTLRTVS